MKKIILLMIAFCALSFSQTVTKLGSYGGGSVEYLAILDWQPFTSDSNAVAYSNTFDLAGVDSISFFNYSSSTNGGAKYLGVLQVSPEPANGYDSIGVAADTTNVKLEAMKYIGNIKLASTNGKGRIKVKGNGYVDSGATINRKDTYVNIYMTLYKGQVAYRVH